MPLITLTKENFDASTDHKDLVLFDFWANWCGPCKAFAPIFEEASKRYPEAIFGKINTEEEPELAAEFNIRSIPTIMIMRQNIVVFDQSSSLSLTNLCVLIEKAKKLDMNEISHRSAV